MSTVVYPATALTGGTSECLDSFDGNDLNNGDIGMVTIPASRVYFYYLDATADLPESSPDVIRPDSNPGTKCWRLLVVQDMDLGADISGQYGVYNVLDYGAVGDGSTDDHEAIENTIRAANAAGGGIVWFPPLTFKCAGGIYPLEELNSITLKGAPGSLLYFDYTVDAWESNFYLYGNDITIDSLHIDTSVTTRNEGHMGSCIVIPQGNRIVVKNCYITNSAGAGIYIQASDVSPYTTTNFDFSYNIIYHTYADGILISDGASHGVISNNLIHTTGDDGISISWAAVNTDEGVYNYPQHIVVSNNKVYHAGHTESTSVGKGLNVNHATDVLFTGNDIIASRGAGFGCYAWIYETESTNWTRSGDTITLTSGAFNLANRYVGGYLYGAETGEAYPITANTTNTLTATGCSVLTSGGAGFLVSCVRARDVRVIGNKFYYCGCISSFGEVAAGYDYFASAYFANAEYCTFSHNVVYAPYYDGVLKLNGINIGCVHDTGGGGGTTRNIEVSHNEFQNLSGRGIMSVANNYLQHVIIKNNTFKTVAEEAVYVYRASSTYYMKGDVVLDGNTFYYVNYTGTTYAGDATAHHIVVDGVNDTSWIYSYRNGIVRTPYNPYYGNYTNLDAESAGSGSISGPLSSTDHAIVRWDGITGSTLQDCNKITINDAGIMSWSSATAGCTINATPTHGGGTAYFQIACNANAGQYNQLKVYGSTEGSYGSVSAYYGDGDESKGIVMIHDGSYGYLRTDATNGTIKIEPQGTTAITATPTSVTVPSLLYTASASSASNIICVNTPGASDHSALQVILNAPAGYYNNLAVYGTQEGSYGSVGAYYAKKETPEGIVIYHNGTNGVLATDTTDGTILIKPEGTTSMTLAPGTVALANGGAINEFSTDGTMAGNSDSAVPTEKAVVTYVAAHAGAGDVVGPASATDNALVRFDTATGKLVQNSAVTLDSGSNISTLSVDNPTVTTNSFLKVVIDGASGNYSQLVVCGSVAGSYGSLAAYYSTGATPEGVVMYHNGSNGVIDTDTTDGTLLIKSEGTTSMTVAPGTLQLANGGAINEFSTDGTLGGNSDSAVPTEKAVKTYAQPLDSDLTTIAGLSKTDGNFIVGNGSAWVAESGSTARTSLGLGSIATQASNNVSITGGSISGLTSLSVSGNITLTGNIEYSSSGLYFTRSSAGKVFIGSTGNLSIGGNLYLNGVSTNYLFVSGNKLYFYNGSTNKEVQFV